MDPMDFGVGKESLTMTFVSSETHFGVGSPESSGSSSFRMSTVFRCHTDLKKPTKLQNAK